jgi:hypothetical protein
MFAGQFSSAQISNNRLTGKTHLVMSQPSKQRNGNSRSDGGMNMPIIIQNMPEPRA